MFVDLLRDCLHEIINLFHDIVQPNRIITSRRDVEHAIPDMSDEPSHSATPLGHDDEGGDFCNSQR